MNAPQCYVVRTLPTLFINRWWTGPLLYMYRYVHAVPPSFWKHFCWCCNEHNLKVQTYSTLTYMPLFDTCWCVCLHVLVCKKLSVCMGCQQQVGQNSGLCSGGNWSRKYHPNNKLIWHCYCVKHHQWIWDQFLINLYLYWAELSLQLAQWFGILFPSISLSSLFPWVTCILWFVIAWREVGIEYVFHDCGPCYWFVSKKLVVSPTILLEGICLAGYWWLGIYVGIFCYLVLGHQLHYCYYFVVILGCQSSKLLMVVFGLLIRGVWGETGCLSHRQIQQAIFTCLVL